jgi:chloramphenicol 3-O-phosphotransferase
VGVIIVISGPVGAGKTAVARELVACMEGPTVYLEGDAFWSFIVRSHPDRPRLRGFQAIMRAMIRAAAAFAAADYQVILDFSMPPAFLERARERLGGHDVHLVVLKPGLTVCVRRAAARSEGAIVDYAPYAELYDAFDAAERHIIRNDILPAAEVAATIQTGIKAGAFRLLD